ncbi:MAG: outer membrane lipoprotein carrier protein LolA [candidate division KSB1 bacterium]|nr:outer membrane lipoprotein carrier protein LolA [candidate division KSB1 bacterium]
MLAIVVKTYILWVLVLGANALQGKDETPRDVLKSVRDTYQSFETVCAEYTQTFHWTLANETRQITGKICTRNGKKFRINTSDQLIVTDGKTLWTVNKMNDQVLIDDATGEQDNPFLKSFYDTYLEHYSADFCSGDSEFLCIVLTAEQQGEFNQTVRLWVDKKNMIRKIERTDINNNRTVFDIQSIETDITLPAETFVYEPDANQEIIDLR